jgi:hypothetical protein
MPLQAFYAILSGGGNRRIAPERIRHLGIVGALATWRVTQGIYRFDPDLAAAVADTPLSGDLPAETLFHLPEWCVYVETPGRRWAGRDLHGFWAHLDYEVGGVADELRLVLDLAETPDAALAPDRGLLPIVFLLGEGSLADALHRATESALQRGPANGLAAALPSIQDTQSLAAELAPLVALLLYLCAENAEIGDGVECRRPAGRGPAQGQPGERHRHRCGECRNTGRTATAYPPSPLAHLPDGQGEDGTTGALAGAGGGQDRGSGSPPGDRAQGRSLGRLIRPRGSSRGTGSTPRGR